METNNEKTVGGAENDASKDAAPQRPSQVDKMSSFQSRRGSGSVLNIDVTTPEEQVTKQMSALERFLAGESPAGAKWCGFCCTTSFVVLLMVMGMGMMKLDISFGWLVKGDSLTQAFFAHFKATDNDYFIEEGGIKFESIATPRSIATPQAQFIYEATGNGCPSKFTGDECDLKKGNLLTPAAIEKIRVFEESIWKDQKYLDKYCALVESWTAPVTTKCVPPRSLLQFLYEDPTGVAAWKAKHTGFTKYAWAYTDADSGAALAAEGGDRWKLIFRSLCNDSVPAMVSMREELLPNFACDGDGDDTFLMKHGTPFLRSKFFFGFPLKENKTTSDSGEWWDDEQGNLTEEFATDFGKTFSDAVEKFNDDNNVVLLGPQTFFFQKAAEAGSYADMFFVLFSFVFVFLYMWFTVESCFVASMGMVQVLGSVFPSVVIWTIFNPKGFQFMQFLAVFMILGIGADDVFVLNDAWQQARVELTEQKSEASTAKIFVLAYRRAFFAMLATTATTSLAFLFGITNAVPAIRDFCIFAAIIVICDFLFCITYFAASVAFYDRFMRGNKCCCCGGPATQGACCQPGCCFGCVRMLWDKLKKKSKESSSDNRFLEHMFGGPLFDWINKWKIVLVICWTVLLLLAIVGVILGVRPQELRSANYINPYHPFQRVQDIQDEYFASSMKQQVLISFGFAEKPIEKWDSDSDAAFPAAETLGYTDIGPAISKAGQQKILDFCTNADKYRCSSQSDCIVSGQKATCETHKVGNVKILKDAACQTGVYCIMEQVRDFAEHRGDAFPYDDLSATLKTAEFKQYLEEYFEKSAHWVRWQYQSGTGVVYDGDNIKYMWLNFNATYTKLFLPYKIGKVIKEDWDAYTKAYLEGTTGMFSSIMLAFTVLQEVLIIEAFKGVAVAIVVALCTLALVTFNWYLAILGTTNILLIMLCFLGFWPILGWEIDIYSSVFLIMAVGLAVDYTVHLLHSFNECALTDRTERVRFALGHMGITVLSGALTTLMAALPLFCTQSQFFFMFGTFVFVIIFLSIAMAILLLIPVLLLVGPKGNFGDITCLYMLAEKCSGSKESKVAADNATVDDNVIVITEAKTTKEESAPKEN